MRSSGGLEGRQGDEEVGEKVLAWSKVWDFLFHFGIIGISERGGFRILAAMGASGERTCGGGAGRGALRLGDDPKNDNRPMALSHRSL
jgi:hypothetical protein